MLDDGVKKLMSSMHEAVIHLAIHMMMLTRLRM